MRQILVVGLVVGLCAPAWPCGNAVQDWVDEWTPVVRRAEKLLSAGQPEQALETLAELPTRLLGLSLARRAFRVETVAREWAALKGKPSVLHFSRSMST